MRHDRSDDDAGDGINMTPMIDVVFLLLIFFLAATTFTTEEHRLDLRLPQARSGQAGKADSPLVVNIAADGRMEVEGRPVTLEALKQKLEGVASREPDRSVLVRGDQQAQFGLGVQVLDMCRLAKIKKVDFAALPAKGP
jgi:biopolymer transport protein ExbD